MTSREQRPQDFLDCIIDLREYDVPYHVRFAIDNGISYVILLVFKLIYDIIFVQSYEVAYSINETPEFHGFQIYVVASGMMLVSLVLVSSLRRGRIFCNVLRFMFAHLILKQPSFL
jgi:hypothetical protein